MLRQDERSRTGWSPRPWPWGRRTLCSRWWSGRGIPWQGGGRRMRQKAGNVKLWSRASLTAFPTWLYTRSPSCLGSLSCSRWAGSCSATEKNWKVKPKKQKHFYSLQFNQSIINFVSAHHLNPTHRFIWCFNYCYKSPEWEFKRKPCRQTDFSWSFTSSAESFLHLWGTDFMHLQLLDLATEIKCHCIKRWKLNNFL